MSVTRAGARSGWRSDETGPLIRDCPKCPAPANRRCLKWVDEKWTEGGITYQGQGRWERMVLPHPPRKSPGSDSPAIRELMAAERIQCDNRAVHKYHWIDEPRVYCRGRART